MVLNSTAMHNGIVGNGNVVADHQPGPLIGAMQHGPILDVGVVADGNGMHISPHNGIKPYRAIVAHLNLAHYNGAIGYVTIFTKNRGKTPYRLNDSHSAKLSELPSLFKHCSLKVKIP
jgi:hypothetical protein